MATDLLSPAVVALSDQDVVDRVRGGDIGLFEVLMRRHNQRLYRAARAILRDESEIDDVMQQAYVSAYTHLHQFEQRSAFATWLTRIVVHEALGRRRRGRERETLPLDEEGLGVDTWTSHTSDPETEAYGQEIRRLLEASIDTLPDAYRLVFVLREVEGLSTAEVADALEVGEEAVKTRLHRARAMLRRDLLSRAGATSSQAFAFHLSRCDRVVEAVFERLARR